MIFITLRVPKMINMVSVNIPSFAGSAACQVGGYRISSVGSHEPFTWYSSDVWYALYHPEGQSFHLNRK